MKRSKSPTSRSWRSSRKAKPAGRSPTCAGPRHHRADLLPLEGKYGGMELSDAAAEAARG